MSFKLLTYLVLLKLVLSINYALAKESPIDCSSTSSEVVFIIDSSNSISVPDFTNVITNIIPSMIEKSTFASSGLKIGIINYSNTTEIAWPLVPMKNIDIVKNRLNTLQKLDQKSRPIDAIHKAAEMLKNADSHTPRLCVWFTDGNFENQDFSKIRKEANNLKNLCHLFLVSSGLHSNSSKLKKLASAPEFALDINRIEVFTQVSKKLAKISCAQIAMVKFNLIRNVRIV